MSSGTQRALLAMLAGSLYFCLLLAAGWDDSATYDEPVHIFSGYLTNVWGNYQLNNFHPPLVKSVATLPLLGLDLPFQKTQLTQPRRSADIAKDWFWHNGHDPQTLLRHSRAALYAFQGILLSVLLFLVSGVSGTPSAVALGLLAFASPAVLGVSMYVTTDACLCLFLLLGLVTYQRLERWGHKRELCFLTLAMAGGLSTKHSFLLLPAVLLGLLAIRLACAGFARSAEARAQMRLLAQVSLASLLGFLFTLLFYGFCMRGLSEAETRQSLERMAGFGSPPFRAVLAQTAEHAALHPVGWYLSGLNRANHYLANGWGIYTSVLGQVYQGGRWYYFPLIILSKENVGISLLILAVWLGWARMGKQGACLQDDKMVVLPSLILAAVYLAIALQSSLNIGFRHIVPCYLCWLYATSQILPRVGKNRLWKVLALLALLRLCSLGATFPHYLSYYNILAGGVRDGYKVSVISDADWGQDLIRLERLLEKRKAGRTHLYYSATADPLYYLKGYLVDDGDLRPGDLVAISTTFAQIPAYLDPESRAKVEKVLTWQPVDQVGGSFLIFQVPESEGSTARGPE